MQQILAPYNSIVQQPGVVSLYLLGRIELYILDNPCVLPYDFKLVSARAAGMRHRSNISHERVSGQKLHMEILTGYSGPPYKGRLHYPARHTILIGVRDRCS